MDVGHLASARALRFFTHGLVALCVGCVSVGNHGADSGSDACVRLDEVPTRNQLLACSVHGQRVIVGGLEYVSDFNHPTDCDPVAPRGATSLMQGVSVQTIEGDKIRTRAFCLYDATQSDNDAARFGFACLTRNTRSRRVATPGLHAGFAWETEVVPVEGRQLHEIEAFVERCLRP